MTLKIVTLAKPGREAFLEKCKESVSNALIPEAEHIIVPGENINFGQVRYEASQLGEYVAFVDDDDTIAPWTIRETYKAILETNSAIAFTKEVYVDLKGNQLQTNYPFSKITYENIAKSPRTAHHLLMMKSDQIDPDCVEAFNSFNTKVLGIEWFMTTSAASGSMGAVYLPQVGYFWTRHNGQSINDNTDRRDFNKFHLQMSNLLINRYSPSKELVKIYNPSI